VLVCSSTAGTGATTLKLACTAEPPATLVKDVGDIGVTVQPAGPERLSRTCRAG
jgi:hypothetical protein